MSDDFDQNSLDPFQANHTLMEPEERMHAMEPGEYPDEQHTNLLAEAPGSDVTQQMLLDDVNNAASWLIYNKGYQQTGFSPADRVDTSTVTSLSREYEITDLHDTTGLQVNPTIVPGDPPVMYITTTNGWIQSRNARTGELYWEHGWTPRPEERWPKTQNRGVGIWQDKVYYASGDNTLLALNRYTGEIVEDFGGPLKPMVVGETQITEKPGEADMRMWDAQYPQMLYWQYQSQEPLPYNGTIYIGESNDVQWGGLHAVDAETGDIVWDMKSVKPEGWVADAWVHGACASWMSPGFDPETETLVFTIGDPSSFFNSMVRPGPNKYSVSFLAVDAPSGEIKWEHQIAPQENWDYDLSDVPKILELDIDGETRKVAVADWKGGFTYVVDLETGKLLRRPDPFVPKQEHRMGRWPFREFLNRVEYGEENAGAIFPAITGGTEWPPGAYSSNTGLQYIGWNDSGTTIWGDPDWHWEHGKIKPDNPDDNAGGLGLVDQENTAGVAALNLTSGEKAWEYTYQDVDPSQPLPFPGGVTASAGDVVFGGSTGGNLVALDANTGDRLWFDDTGGRITASPVIWDDPQTSTQYVTVAANDKIISYSLSE